LRLPDIRPVLIQHEDEVTMLEAMGISGLAEASHFSTTDPVGYCSSNLRSASRTRRSETSSALPTGRCGRGFDPAAGYSSAPRSAASGRGGRARTTTRPTQRQWIDDTTTVPAEVFESMLKAGAEAKSRATHRLAFRPQDGVPYLHRHEESQQVSSNSNMLENMNQRVVDLFAAPPQNQDIAGPLATQSTTTPLLPMRPSSGCATEMLGNWGSASGGLSLPVS